MLSNFFGHLKRALELLIFVENEPSRDILAPLSQYNHPWEKQQNKKKTRPTLPGQREVLRQPLSGFAD